MNELRGALTPEELNSVDKAAGFKTMLLFLRLYAQDPVTANMNKDLINFGFVEPPLVEYRVGASLTPLIPMGRRALQASVHREKAPCMIEQVSLTDQTQTALPLPCSCRQPGPVEGAAVVQ